MLEIPLEAAHLVLLLRLSTVCRKDRWAWSSSKVEQSSSSSSMMPHCTQRRRGSRCPALQTQAVARDWGNSSITKGSRWAGSVSMLVAMLVNGGPKCKDETEKLLREEDVGPPISCPKNEKTVQKIQLSISQTV